MISNLKVLFITHKYPPSIGGMENQCFHLVKELSSKLETVLIAYDNKEGRFSFFKHLRARVEQCFDRHPDISVVHCNDGTIAQRCVWIKRKYEVPLTATLHGLDVTFPSIIYQKILLKKLHQFDQIYAVSEGTRQACLARGFEPAKVITIANGVDHDIADIEIDSIGLKATEKKHQFSFDQDRVIVSIGRAVGRKGFSWFAKEVLPKIKEGAIYIIIGPLETKPSFLQRLLEVIPPFFRRKVDLLLGYPTDTKAIRDLLHHNSHRKNRVIHLGKLPFKLLVSCVARSRVFVMPNIEVPGDFEGFGLVALEAGLTGTPVLVADIEGIKEAVHHNRNGKRIASMDIDSWTSELNAILEPNPKQSSNNDQVEYIKQHFSWEIMARKYLICFESLT